LALNDKTQKVIDTQSAHTGKHFLHICQQLNNINIHEDMYHSIVYK